MADDNRRRQERSATLSNLTQSISTVDKSMDGIVAKAEKAMSSWERMAKAAEKVGGNTGAGGGGGFFGSGGMRGGTFGYDSSGRGAIGGEGSEGTMLAGTSGYKYTGLKNAFPFFKDALGGAATAAAGAGLLAMPSIPDALQLNLLANRQRLYGSPGDTVTTGFLTSAALSRVGTPTNPMDAAFAANNAMAYGFMPANAQSYGNALGGAALVSNLRPGVGLQGGMQAVGALNQARSVNLLRMIGVNVRSNQGTGIRGVADIIEELWKILTNANGGKPPSREDISVSAMSGNALDSILNQYFSGDENLRFAVLTGLIQKAAGGTLDIQSLEATGATTRAIRSTAEINSNLLASRQLFSAPVLQGMMAANKLGSKSLNFIADLGTKKGLVGEAVQNLMQVGGFLDAFSGLGDGAGGLMLTGLSKAGKGMMQGLGQLIPGIEGTAVPGKLGGLASVAVPALMALNNGAFANTTPGEDVYNKLPIKNSPVSSGNITVNVTMDGGNYSTGIEAGNAIANHLINAMKVS